MEISVSPLSQPVNHNVVIVVLEGIQYAHTSLAHSESELTPYLLTLAQQGVEFADTRSCMSHTTKALFGLLTGRYPSALQDLAEAVPVAKPYAGLATVLKRELNFRTAFFQSAKGSFEGRPGLVGNLGFEQYHAREDLDNEDAFVGYLGSDEFAMIEPIARWIKSDHRPFLLTILCSVTHDPYEIPERLGEQAKEQLDRYRQAISYTDKFIAALDGELAKLSPREETIFCVVGDHGEAFGEHGLFGHERIAFEEVLRVPWVMRAEFLIKPATRITKSVSSVDLTPTILGLLGFDMRSAGFDGTDVLGPVAANRRTYFSCWMQEGPVGFVAGSRKFIYNSTTKTVSVYNLSTDPLELRPRELSQERADKITGEILRWRQGTIFRPEQEAVGEKMLFGRWKCRWWNNRAPVAKAEYSPENGN
jgi:phosphoglycerol transferase MdoB-like AlkP superfamily enzyme